MMDHFIPPASSPNAQSLLDSTLFSPLDTSLTSQPVASSSVTGSTAAATARQNNSAAAAAAAAAASASGHNTATPVISLFKLKNFLYQPKFKPPFVQSTGDDKTGDWWIILLSLSFSHGYLNRM